MQAIVDEKAKGVRAPGTKVTCCFRITNENVVNGEEEDI